MNEAIVYGPFKVMNIEQEHWTMAMRPCECGASWRRGSQRLIEDGDVPCDEHDVTCPSCGATATFRFDVSGFFGHESKVEAWAEALLPGADARVIGRIVRKVGPPFGMKFQSLVQGLANDRDLATLLYLRARIDSALSSLQAQETREG